MIKIAVAVTGASGSIYAKLLLEQLQRLKDQVAEVSTVWSDNAFTVWQHELGNKDYETFPFRAWDKNDFMAPFASGSSSYSALIICPCSMGTIGRIAGCISNDLVTRAADVMLKERRKLIVVPRETPLGSIALDNMKRLSDAGGVVLPAMPGFYHQPKSIADLVDFVVARICNQLGVALDKDLLKPWGS